MGKLTANEVKATLTKPGTYGDGDGLFLKVSRTGGASWLLRVQHEGKRRDIGLGSAKLVTLAAARAKAAEAHKATREDGRDLVAEKQKAKTENVTFREAAPAYHETHKDQWANAKHGDQWINTMKAYLLLGEDRATIRYTIKTVVSGGPRPLRMGYLCHEKTAEISQLWHFLEPSGRGFW